jgi:hypothetical protein
MFERDDIGLGAGILIVYFLTRVFAEEWSGVAVLTVSISVGPLPMVAPEAEETGE